MAYLLDYSAKQLSGPTVKNAGYAGAIRYIDATQGGKRTTNAEYASLVASGLIVRLVMEVSTGDANGGYSRGVEYAKRAKLGADALGYAGVIYFCNDSPTLSSATLWDDYLTGAASVLGWGRVGAYGFANAMDVAAHLTDCKHFWQAGRRSDVRPFVQIWQDNNTQVTVGGITCDRNLILQPLTGDNDMQPSDLVTNPATGQPALDINGKTYTYGQAWYYDNLNGWALRDAVTDLAKEVAAVKAAQTAPAPVQVDVEQLAAALKAAVANAVADEVARRLAE